MQLESAILQLSSHLGARHALREYINIARTTDTYFATIPKDIIDIILEMVPDFRQTYTDEQIMRASQQYSDFRDKYIDYANQINPQYKTELFTKMNDSYPPSTVYIKSIHHGQHAKLTSLRVGIIYVSKHRFVYRRPLPNENNPHRTMYKTNCRHMVENDPISNIEELFTVHDELDYVFLLPCGLTLVMLDRQNQVPKSYLLDFDNDKYIKVEYSSTTLDYLIDDFGRKIEHNLSYQEFCFSDLTPFPFRCSC